MNFNTIMLQADAAQGGGGQWIFLIAIFVIFYFFMIRPQQQQQKKLREQRNSMQKGDNVITSGGLQGKIDGIITRPNKKGVEEVDSFIITLKPDNNVRVTIAKDCVYKDLTDVQQQQR